MNTAEKLCRTCGKTSQTEDGSDLYPMYTSTEYCQELKMVLEEFDIWNLNIAQDDGLPQKICLTCFDSFCQIHNFRMICQEAQTNFGEFCTGLDIIIKVDPEFGDLDAEWPEDFEGEQTITVQEHYHFPGDERSKASDLQQPDDPKTYSKLFEVVNFDEERRLEEARKEALDEENAVLPVFKRYQCEYCMDVVSFDDPDHLNQHYNLRHSTDTPFHCPKCEKSFNSKAKRNTHARVHFRIIVECDICGKKVRGGKRMMAQHKELHHVEKNRECETCGKQFEKITLKRFHYHQSWHDDSKLHKCKYCEKKFIQINHLVVHERTHTGESPFLCNECGAGFKNSGLLNNHLKIHGLKELDCPHCDKKFYHKHGLKLHMQVHDPNRKVPRCDLCDKPFRSNMNLRLHNHKRHGAPASAAVLNIIKKRLTRTTFIKPYKCSKCPEAFVLHTQLMKHLKTHDEDRPFSCKTCQKSFKREAHLKVHVNSVHLNRKPHRCLLCGWTFPQRANLREHHAAKHTDKKEHKCKLCGKEFSILKTLKTHMLKHMDKKPFICTVCNKGFRQLGVLKAHMNGHFRKNEVDVAGGDITDIIVETLGDEIVDM